jgi:hypothetical protein
MLKRFSACDDMLDFFQRKGLDYTETSATEPVDVLDVDREALAAFDDFVDAFCDHIRSNAESSNGNKWLALVRGAPGAGKTTLAQEVLDPRLDIDSDRFFEDKNGNYAFDPSKLGKAHSWCRSRVEEAMSEGVQSIAVHNTFSQQWEMVRYFGMAAEHGYRVYSLVAENRHGGKTEHGVPERKIDEMRDRFQFRL